VTVQKDDGTSVVIAQRDTGDIQMGDRVMIVYDPNGVASVVRDTGRRRDY
jgi:outer membrane lipoprotein SlyB